MSIQGNINTLLGIAGAKKVVKKEVEKPKAPEAPKPQPVPTPQQQEVVVPEGFYESAFAASEIATNTANENIKARYEQREKLKTRMQQAKEKQLKRHLDHAELVKREKQERDERRGK
jgi:hypothetical protein